MTHRVSGLEHWWRHQALQLLLKPPALEKEVGLENILMNKGKLVSGIYNQYFRG